MPVHPEEYSEIVSRVNKRYEGDLKKGNEYENPSRISTGSLELDACMGGGIPVGRWTRLWGGYHSCKTLTALNVIREAQALGLLCAYYNVEKQYDPVFTKEKIGVNIDELTLVEGSSIEEIGDKMEALLGVVHLHVIDSCSIAVSEDELNADIRDWRPGITARAWGKVFRRLNERFDHGDNTVILLDQVRTNFQTNSEQIPGGKILDHQSSMTVHLKKGKWLFRNSDGFLDEKAKQTLGISGQMEPSGIEIRARVDKSRVSRPFLTASLRLDLDRLEFDRTFEYIKLAKHYRIIEQKARYYYYDEQRFDSLKQMRQFINMDAGIREQIRSTVMAAVRNS